MAGSRVCDVGDRVPVILVDCGLGSGVKKDTATSRHVHALRLGLGMGTGMGTRFGSAAPGGCE